MKVVVTGGGIGSHLVTIIEAMRSRLPGIASDVGGVSELVENSVNGILVRPADITDLRDKLALLLRDPGTPDRMGQAGRERYERNFTFDRMLSETLDAYEAILAKQLMRPEKDARALASGGRQSHSQAAL